MLVKRTKWSVKLGLAITFLATSVFAAPGQGGTGAGSGAKAQMNFAKSSQLSLTEQLNQVANYNTKMVSIQASVAKKAAQAKKDGDLVKLDCINSKKASIDANVQVGAAVAKAFASGGVRADESQRNFQFSKITIAHLNTVVLGGEADACIGEDLAYVGKTKTTTTQDESITKKDTTKTKSDHDDSGAPTRGTSVTPVR